MQCVCIVCLVGVVVEDDVPLLYLDPVHALPKESESVHLALVVADAAADEAADADSFLIMTVMIVGWVLGSMDVKVGFVIYMEDWHKRHWHRYSDLTI